MLGLSRAKCAFLIIVLALFASTFALAQQSRVLLNDAKVVVTEVEVSPDASYTLPQSQNGVVWVAIDTASLLTMRGGQRNTRQIHAGDSGMRGTGEELQFRADGGSRGRLVVIHPKTQHQELTVGPFDITTSLEDASDRNATLLVAITDCRFRDVRNLGDESTWKSSRPQVVEMMAGSVKWIAPGIHHFENTGRTPAKLLSIEW
jgi:hypothetical protein